MEKYCTRCDDFRNCISIQQEETFQVRDEEITIFAEHLKCDTCGEIIPDLELDETNYQLVYAEFRKRKSFLQPNEIKQLREMYGISQRNLAKLLGWGHATISRYESGAVQGTAHNNQLLSLKQPENMLEILEQGRTKLSPRDFSKIKNNIISLINNHSEATLYSAIENFYIRKGASAQTGFRKFNLDRVVNAIKHFAVSDPECLKVKLMKYLWYSDFLHFKRYTVSISGLGYVHLPLGPVPEKHQILLDLASENGVDTVVYPIGSYLGEKFIALDEVDYNVFSPEETDTMNCVLGKFRTYTSTAISDHSHKETAYTKTADGEIIPYVYASDLSID